MIQGPTPKERYATLLAKARNGQLPFNQQQLVDIFQKLIIKADNTPAQAVASVDLGFNHLDKMLENYQGSIDKLGTSVGSNHSADAIKNSYQLNDKWAKYFDENDINSEAFTTDVLRELTIGKLEAYVNHASDLNAYGKSKGVTAQFEIGKGQVIAKSVPSMPQVERLAAVSDFKLIEAERKDAARKALKPGIISDARAWLSDNYNVAQSIEEAKESGFKALNIQKQSKVITANQAADQYHELNALKIGEDGSLDAVKAYREKPVTQRIKSGGQKLAEAVAQEEEAQAQSPLTIKPRPAAASTQTATAPVAKPSAPVASAPVIDPLPKGVPTGPYDAQAPTGATDQQGLPSAPQVQGSLKPTDPSAPLIPKQPLTSGVASRQAAIAEAKNAAGQVQDKVTGQWHDKNSPEGQKIMAAYNTAIAANTAQTAAQTAAQTPSPQGSGQPQPDPEKMTGQFQEVLDAMKRGDTKGSILNAASFLQDFTGMVAGLNQMGDSQLEDYAPSKYLNEMVRVTRNMAETGTPEIVEEQQRADVRRGLDVDLGVVKQAAGGSGGAVLGTRFQSIRDYNDALAKVSVQDMEAKFRAMPMYMDALGQMEAAHKERYAKRYEMELARQNAAADLVSGSIKNMHNAAQMEQYYGAGSVNAVLKWADATKIAKERDNMVVGGNALAENLDTTSGVGQGVMPTYTGGSGVGQSPIVNKVGGK
jgi:hypothetical protein